MRHATFSLIVLSLLVLIVCVSQSRAYDKYSNNGDDNCEACHGAFRSSNYISLTDGKDWGNLHNLHRQTMLSGDCSTCHSAGDRFPVFTGVSQGGDGFEAISCVGCHGRNEDIGHDSVSPGRGAGLRQHHSNAGIGVCANCHEDADPANYTPVGEDVAPSYYFTPDGNHPDKPTNACSPNGEEDYAGVGEGLDNDGDGLYDQDNTNCAAGDCPWDFDGSGDVGFGDLVSLLANWGPCENPEDCPWDFDGSGEVGFNDLVSLLANWGPCPG